MPTAPGIDKDRTPDHRHLKLVITVGGEPAWSGIYAPPKGVISIGPMDMPGVTIGLHPGVPGSDMIRPLFSQTMQGQWVIHVRDDGMEAMLGELPPGGKETKNSLRPKDHILEDSAGIGYIRVGTNPQRMMVICFCLIDPPEGYQSIKADEADPDDGPSIPARLIIALAIALPLVLVGIALWH